MISILATCFREKKITEFGVITLDVINWIVVVKVQQCVYCEVRTKFVCVIIWTSALKIELK
jgi:hypothetical protein